MFLLIEEELFGFKLGWRERIVIDWKIRSCAYKMQARLLMGSVTWTVQALNSLSVKWSLLMTSREAYTSELYKISFIWKSLRPHMKEKCWRKAEVISQLLLSSPFAFCLSLSLSHTHSNIQGSMGESPGIQLPHLYRSCTKDNAKCVGFPDLPNALYTG